MEQSEIDALMAEANETSEPEVTDDSEKKEEIGWDDVQEEMAASRQPVAKREVRSVEFEELEKNGTGTKKLDLDFILDIPLTVTVELGRGRMQVGELLKLGQGSVVELSKLAGEPMEVFANNELIAKGEVVVVNERFGVRLTDIVSPEERLKRLK